MAGTTPEDTEVITGNSYDYKDSSNIEITPGGPGKTDLTSNTGAGIEAALGTNGYSWDKKAEERANLSYQSDVLTAKQNYLEQRQNIEQQGQQLQAQYDMAQYNNNQSAEKVGWTGGYALDEKRQMDYLKSTIQSQMYGTMELQKHGYDTSLAAARLAYDTNKYDLALEYYNTALSRAITEAEVTGLYISPEASEMRAQYIAANDILDTDPDNKEAQQIKDATTKWFKDNNISENGIYTFNALMELNTLYLSMWDKYGEEANQSLLQLPDGAFINVNVPWEQIAIDGAEKHLIRFNNMTPGDTISYVESDSTGTAKEQVFGYFDNLIGTALQRYLDDVKIVNGTGENQTVEYATNPEAFKKAFLQNEGAVIQGLLDKLKEEGKTNLFDGFDETVAAEFKNLPVYISIVNGELKVDIGSKNNPLETTKNIDGINTTWNNSEQAYQADNGTKLYDLDGNFIGYNPEDTTKLWDEMKQDGYHMSNIDKKVFNLTKDTQATLGKILKQNDFNTSTATGAAGEYIAALKEAVIDNKIEVGQIVKFNYGKADHDLIYVYIGNGNFANVNDDKYQSTKEQANLFVPTGFYTNHLNNITKR